MAADLDPDIVPAARRNDRKPLPGENAGGGQIVLNRAERIERLPCIFRQKLADHAGHRLEGQRARGDLRLPGRSDDIRTLARMEHEGLAVGANESGQERGYEGHRYSTRLFGPPDFRPKLPVTLL